MTSVHSKNSFWSGRACIQKSVCMSLQNTYTNLLKRIFHVRRVLKIHSSFVIMLDENERA